METSIAKIIGDIESKDLLGGEKGERELTDEEMAPASGGAGIKEGFLHFTEAGC